MLLHVIINFLLISGLEDELEKEADELATQEHLHNTPVKATGNLRDFYSNLTTYLSKCLMTFLWIVYLLKIISTRKDCLSKTKKGIRKRSFKGQCLRCSCLDSKRAPNC